MTTVKPVRTPGRPVKGDRKLGRPRKDSSIPHPKENRSLTEHGTYYKSYPFGDQEFSGDISIPHLSIIKMESSKSMSPEWSSMIPYSDHTCNDTHCTEKHIHCPLCPLNVHWYDDKSDMEAHFIKMHTAQHFVYSDHVIVLCNLACNDKDTSHYHCPQCGLLAVRSLHMRSHLARCTAQHSSKHTQQPPQKEVVKAKRQRFPSRYKDSIWETTEVDSSGVLNTAAANDIGGDDTVITADELEVNSLNDKDLKLIQFQLDGEETRYMVIDQSGSTLDEQQLQNVLVPPSQDHSNLDQHGLADKTPDDTFQPVTPHVSIIRRVEDLPCKRCEGCCQLFHCPLCPRDLYKPQHANILKKHMLQHFKIGVLYKGWTSMKCNLPCGETENELVKAHWHCPLCPQVKIHRSRLREHLTNHSRGRNRVGKSKVDHEQLVKQMNDMVGKGLILKEQVGMAGVDDVGDEGLIDGRQELVTEGVEEGLGSVNDENSDQPGIVTNMGDSQLTCETPPRTVSVINDIQTTDSDRLWERTDEPVNELDLQREPQAMTVQVVGEDTDIPLSGSIHVISKEDINGTLSLMNAQQFMELSKNLPEEEPITMLDDADTSSNLPPVEESSTETDTTPETRESTIETPTLQVFEVVAGLMTTELTQRLGVALDNILTLLQDITGISSRSQDPDDTSYLLQGSWIQMYKAHILLEIFARSREDEELDTSDVLKQARELHPDLFPIEIEDPEPSVEDLDDDLPIQIAPDEPCPYCRKKFRYKISLFFHVIKMHNLDKKPKYNAEKWECTLKRIKSIKEPVCPDCGRKFSNIMSAQTHYSTSVCRKESNAQGGVEVYNTDPVTGNYMCPQCSYSTRTTSILAQHIKLQHIDKTVKCGVCDKFFATEVILRNHMKTTHAPEATCSECGVSVKVQNLHKHMLSKHLKVLDALTEKMGEAEEIRCIMKCEQCNYCTTQMKLMSRHVHITHESTERICKDCGLTFRNKLKLYEHKREVHGIGMMSMVSRLYGKCHLCNKEMLKRNITAHIRLTHSNVRRYECSVCQKKFQTKYVLEMHEQKHKPAGERQYRYICPYCNMGYLAKGAYNDHIHLHTSNRPYKCTKCNSSFRQKSVFRRHMEIHDSMHHECEICKQVFNTKYGLQHHMKRHEKAQNAAKSDVEEPNVIYGCFCGQTFENSGMLTEHTKQCPVLNMDDTTGDNIPMLTQSEGETVILIQPQGTMTDSDVLTIQPSDELHAISDITDIQTVQDLAIQQLNIIEENAVNMTEQNDITMSGIDSEGMTEEHEGFMCGYCKSLYPSLESVQTHIVLEHADQLHADQLHADQLHADQ